MHVVKFNPVSELTEDTVPMPKPARNYIPEWYKRAPAFETKKPQIDKMGMSNPALKMCMPFIDAMSSGYIQESWQDIVIQVESRESEKVSLGYSSPTLPEIIGHREKVSVPMGEDFYPIEFIFHPVWIPQLPKGWSMLYTSPINRPDLPFQVLSGIVDSDSFYQSEEGSRIPFYVKNNFEGIIPKGTPMIQMIPIKRSSWESFKNKYSQREQNKMIVLARQHFWGGYKKTFWHKKTYR
jgi:hypothetical protein